MNGILGSETVWVRSGRGCARRGRLEICSGSSKSRDVHEYARFRFVGFDCDEDDDAMGSDSDAAGDGG